MRWFMAVCLMFAISTPTQAVEPSARITIVLDAGHGGSDIGARRRYDRQVITEAQLSWGVVAELQRLLSRRGVPVDATTRSYNIPGEADTVLFGADVIPARGADAFNTLGQPPITSGRHGLEQRLIVAHQAVLDDSLATVLFISIHFDHVPGDGCPAGARIIYPAGTYDTLLVECLAASLDSAGLLRPKDHRPTIANGRSGLGRHLLILRQGADPRRVRERHATRLIYNRVESSVLLELANLSNASDWQRLQEPDILRRFARNIDQALIEYARRRSSLTP